MWDQCPYNRDPGEPPPLPTRRTRQEGGDPPPRRGALPEPNHTGALTSDFSLQPGKKDTPAVYKPSGLCQPDQQPEQKEMLGNSRC